MKRSIIFSPYSRWLTSSQALEALGTAGIHGQALSNAKAEGSLPFVVLEDCGHRYSPEGVLEIIGNKAGRGK